MNIYFLDVVDIFQNIANDFCMSTFVYSRVELSW